MSRERHVSIFPEKLFGIVIEELKVRAVSLVDYEEHVILVGNGRQSGDIREHPIVIRTRHQHSLRVRIRLTGGLQIRRQYLADKPGSQIRLRLDVYWIDAAQPQSTESRVMRIAAEYQLATHRDGAHDGSHDAGARSVHKKLGVPDTVQVGIVVHDGPQRSLRAEQSIRARYLGYIAGHYILKKVSVSCFLVYVAAALVARHVKRDQAAAAV